VHSFAEPSIRFGYVGAGVLSDRLNVIRRHGGERPLSWPLGAYIKRRKAVTQSSGLRPAFTPARQFCHQSRIVRHDNIPGCKVPNHEAFMALLQPYGDEKTETCVETDLIAFLRIGLSCGFRKPLSQTGDGVAREECGRAFTDKSPVTRRKGFRPLRIVFRQYARYAPAILEPSEGKSAPTRDRSR